MTISLGLPTLNEEETIGAISAPVQHELVNRHPLLDEIVAVDSGSTDRTREIADSVRRAGGAPPGHPPRAAAATGARARALWKACTS